MISQIRYPIMIIFFLFASMAFSGSAQTQFQFHGQWYQGISFPHVTVQSLGAKVGDTVTIRYNVHGSIYSAWGSMTLGKCVTKAQEKQSVTTCQITGANPWSQALSFGINLLTQAPQSGVGQVTVSSGKALNKGTINIELPKKPDYIKSSVLPDVIINNEAGTPVAEIDNKAWGSTIPTTVFFTNDKASFSVTVKSINHIMGYAKPDHFSLVNRQTQDVSISYKSTPQGSVSISIKTKSGTIPQVNPSYQILNNQQVPVKTGTLTWKTATDVNDIPMHSQSAVFTLKTPDFTSDDQKYTAIGGVERNMTVNRGQSTPVTITYQGRPITQKESVKINVKKLPQGQSARVTLKDQQSGQSYSIPINHNGDYPAQTIARNGDQWTVSASSINHYQASIIPSIFSADKGQQAIAITYYHPPLTKRLFAGYVDITATTAAEKTLGSNEGRDPGKNHQKALEKLKADGYNTIIFAFADVNGAQMTAHVGTQAFYPVAKMAREMGFNVLISVGGQNNTFNPQNADPKALANNINVFLKRYGFQGIDFDLEMALPPNYLDTLIQNIRAINPNVIITAAPQLNYVNDTQGIQFVSTGSNMVYSQAIHNGDFNYLFVQEYNTGSYYIDAQGQGKLTYQCQNDKTCASEHMPAFIYNSFLNMQRHLKVPVNTKIVVGEPSDLVGAGFATLYHPPSNVTLMIAQAIPLINQQIEKLVGSPQFGGVMDWSMNVDYDAPDYGGRDHKPGAFAQGVSRCAVNSVCH